MFKKDELTRREAESKRELELLDQQMADTVLVQNSLEEKIGMAAMFDVEGLTKDLVVKLFLFRIVLVNLPLKEC